MSRPPRAPNEERSCWSETLAYLSSRERSEKELRQRLSEKLYPSHEIDACVEKSKNLSFLDDERAAERAIETLSRSKGKAFVVRACRERGFSRDVVEAAFEKMDALSSSDAERAADLLRKQSKFSSKDPVVERKAWAYLARRGFSSSDCKKAWSLFLSDDLE